MFSPTMACRQLSRLLPLCLNATPRQLSSSIGVLLRQSPVQARNCRQPLLTFNQQKRQYTTETLECVTIQDEEDFQKRVLQSSTPVVVDFHATWCGPCKLLAPRLEKICEEHKGDIILAKVDIDENGELAMQYGVQSVPTVIAVRGGKKVGEFIGLQPDDAIESFIEKLKH